MNFQARSTPTETHPLHKIQIEVRDWNKISLGGPERTISKTITHDINIDGTMRDYSLCFHVREEIASDGNNYDSDHIEIKFRVGYQLDTIYFDNISFLEDGIAVVEGDTISPGVFDVSRPKAVDYGCTTPEKMTDYKQFLTDTESDYYATVRDHVLNTLGANIPLSGSQTTWASLFSSQIMSDDSLTDFADVHTYFGSVKADPNENDVPDRRASTMAWSMDNKSVLEDLDNSFLKRFTLGRLLNKPFMITEYNHAGQNQFRQESVPMIAAFAAHQDIDGIVYFRYSEVTQDRDGNGDIQPPIVDVDCPLAQPFSSVDEWCEPNFSATTILGTLSLVGSPRLEAQSYLGAHIFRRGDVAASTTTAQIALSDEAVKATMGEYGAGGGSIGVVQDERYVADADGNLLNIRTALKYRLGACHAAVPGCPTISSNFIDIGSTELDYTSDTGEVEWHEAGSLEGMYMSTNTDHTKLTSGIFESIGSKDFDGIVITDQPSSGASYERFSTVALTSADQSPILTAETVLLSSIGRAVNGNGAGAPLQVVAVPDGIYEVDGNVYLCDADVYPCTRAWNDPAGNTGVFLEQTLYDISYAGAASILTVTTIDGFGAKTATTIPVSTNAAATGYQFTIGNNPVSPWYQIDGLMPDATALLAERTVDTDDDGMADAARLVSTDDSLSIDLPPTLASGWYFLELRARSVDFDLAPSLTVYLDGAGTQMVGASTIGSTIGDTWKGSLPSHTPIFLSRDVSNSIRLVYQSGGGLNPVDVDQIVLVPAYTQPGIDSDADGIMNGISDGASRFVGLDNCPVMSNVDQADIDADGVGDVCDSDRDGDGLSDALEIALGLNIENPDTDGDGLSDGTELAFDGDGLSYDPTTDLNPFAADTDGDGIGDALEVALGSNPLLISSTPATGDINDDGSVGGADILLVIKFILGLTTPTPEQAARADVAPIIGGVSVPDQNIGIGDALIIQRIVFGAI